MKIRLAILEKDVSYMKKLVTAFTVKFSDNLEIYSFTTLENALQNLAPSRVDVFLAGESFEIDTKALPTKCAFGYFVDSVGIESFRDCPAICKFQKAELIYKQILSLYSEKATDIAGPAINGGLTKIISFVSASGGVGTSTMAMACATALAKADKKVLYVNLEELGDPEVYFEGEGNYNFSDVIFALRSQKTNLTLKLEGTVRHATNGVFYYAAPEVALDMLDLQEQDVKRMLAEMCIAGGYDYIIVDSRLDFSEVSMVIWNEADTVILVTDGMNVSNRKLERMVAAFLQKEKNDERLKLSKAMLLYNKYSNRLSERVQGIDIAELGGVQRFDGATLKQIVEQISGMALFNKLL